MKKYIKISKKINQNLIENYRVQGEVYTHIDANKQ